MKKVLLTAVMLLAFAAAAVAQTKGLTTAIYEQPALITSVGQSADYKMVVALFKRNNLEYKESALAAPAELKGVKTLVLVIGGSSKGLGAAGIDADQEAKRVQTLIDAAKAQGTKIIALHVGGDARRGDLTDRYIKLSTASADYTIVVASGNGDKIFTKAMDGKLLDEATNIVEVGPFLKKAFK